MYYAFHGKTLFVSFLRMVAEMCKKMSVLCQSVYTLFIIFAAEIAKNIIHLINTINNES